MVESSQDTDRLADPEAVAVREALERILASDAFRSAPQLSAFLNFIVERRIEGRSAELKGYTIAVEAFGRPADFDPQSDPIVRVEAGRLRKALGQYYQGDGADDPIRISMPVGAYVPVFEHLGADGAVVEPAPERAVSGDAGAVQPPIPERQSRHGFRLGHWLAVLGLALVIVPLATWHYLPRRETAPQPDPLIRQAQLIEEAARRAGSSASAHLPMVVVSLSGAADDPELAGLVQAFTRLLVDALARFDDLVTVRTPAAGADLYSGADYVFEMNATRQGGATEGFGRLRSVKDGRVVWTTSAIQTLPKGEDAPELREIARRLAVRLAEPFGIIHADYRQATTASPMRCVFQALNIRRTMRAEDHLAARNCLEGVLERDPAFHPAWSQLALLTVDEYTAGLNPLPGSPLDRALSAALTAVRLAPSSARAQQAMMDVYFARGAHEDAFRAGRAALVRNPYDPDIMADLGARYVQIGRPTEGLPLLQRAVASSSGRPAWYDFYAFLAEHLLGNDKRADAHAAIFVADDSPLSLLGRALHLAGKHDEPGVSAALRRLTRAAPLFALDARLYLSRMGFSEAVIDRIMADLGPRRLEASGVH